MYGGRSMDWGGFDDGMIFPKNGERRAFRWRQVLRARVGWGGGPPLPQDEKDSPRDYD